jgi:hypothetical protein
VNRHRLDWAVKTASRDDGPTGNIAWRFYLIVRACCGSTWRHYLWIKRPERRWIRHTGESP